MWKVGAGGEARGETTREDLMLREMRLAFLASLEAFLLRATGCWVLDSECLRTTSQIFSARPWTVSYTHLTLPTTSRV